MRGVAKMGHCIGKNVLRIGFHFISMNESSPEEFGASVSRFDPSNAVADENLEILHIYFYLR